MDRRTFLSRSAFGGGAVATAGLAAPAIAQGKQTLSMVTTWPRGLVGVWNAVSYFAKAVDQITDGYLTIDAKGAGEQVGAMAAFDAVTSGQADLYHGADYYFTERHPAFAYFTTVPFGMTAPEMMAWYYGGDGMALHHKLGARFGLRSFLAGQTGAQGGGWFRTAVATATDFQGLKMRMPGLGGLVVAELGAEPQQLGAGEIYQALSTGALDAAEWIGPWSDETLGLQEICNSYYPAGFHEPGAALSVAANLDMFERLSPVNQRALKLAAAATHQQNYADFTLNNGPAMARLIAGGTQVLQFPHEVWDAFGAASVTVLERFMQDELFTEIHRSAQASMRASSGWLAMSDGVYSAQRNRVLAAL